MSTGGTALVGVVILIGLIGVVVPLLPGTLLVFGAILVWALVEQTLAGWVTLAVVTVLVAVTTAVKYLWPVQRMRRADVSNASLVAGGVLGIVGFFVIPVLGLAIGFVGGIYLAELLRRHDQRIAWTSTVHALKGVALSMLVELTGALAAAGIWLGAVLLG
ncbi:DUF456 domain-containing protein [Mycobacterium sp. MYCO198283]|uniref:DUF456 domain-containing protein n=1 Tax=Mycobacterium sp. MYCO198283 TaxID=2883505 RepID=UPI001E612337|nr:DUF456 domain-containing protein [Mycobacterium sp. MYCO198283]MCG5434495.1 DUF456 domain-containing protein [Mycobacterium sp. MYCO198283]